MMKTLRERTDAYRDEMNAAAPAEVLQAFDDGATALGRRPFAAKNERPRVVKRLAGELILEVSQVGVGDLAVAEEPLHSPVWRGQQVLGAGDLGHGVDRLAEILLRYPGSEDVRRVRGEAADLQHVGVEDRREMRHLRREIPGDRAFPRRSRERVD